MWERASRFCDSVTICNVLNVIKENEVIDKILHDVSRLPVNQVYISVYEGDGSGCGRETSKGYQRNQRLREYGHFIKKYFVYRIMNGVAYCCPKKEIEL